MIHTYRYKMDHTMVFSRYIRSFVFRERIRAVFSEGSPWRRKWVCSCSSVSFSSYSSLFSRRRLLRKKKRKKRGEERRRRTKERKETKYTWFEERIESFSSFMDFLERIAEFLFKQSFDGSFLSRYRYLSFHFRFLTFITVLVGNDFGRS